MIIELTHEELEQCREFAYICAENQQPIEFGQSDTAPRSNKEIGRDNYIGKIAETAFAKMMRLHYRDELIFSDHLGDTQLFVVLFC